MQSNVLIYNRTGSGPWTADMYFYDGVDPSGLAVGDYICDTNYNRFEVTNVGSLSGPGRTGVVMASVGGGSTPPVENVKCICYTPTTNLKLSNLGLQSLTEMLPFHQKLNSIDNLSIDIGGGGGGVSFTEFDLRPSMTPQFKNLPTGWTGSYDGGSQVATIEHSENKLATICSIVRSSAFPETIGYTTTSPDDDDFVVRNYQVSGNWNKFQIFGIRSDTNYHFVVNLSSVDFT